jgi:hypothetical protein
VGTGGGCTLLQIHETSMIILLNGAIGVGKTTTALDLVHKISGLSVIDGELLAPIRPFDPNSSEMFDYACTTLQILLDHHSRHGFDHFVVSWILETPEKMQRFHDTIPVNLRSSVQSFLLLCEIGELIGRIKTRNRPDVAHEIRRGRELFAVLQAAANGGNLGYPIDTTSIESESVAKLIYERLPHPL